MGDQIVWIRTLGLKSLEIIINCHGLKPVAIEQL